MIKATKAGLDSVKCTATKVLAVTVLTSINRETCEEIYTRLPIDQVLKLAEIANRAGADGFVCSAEEVGALKAKYPDKIFVTPGFARQEKIPVISSELIRRIMHMLTVPNI